MGNQEDMRKEKKILDEQKESEDEFNKNQMEKL